MRKKKKINYSFVFGGIIIFSFLFYLFFFEYQGIEISPAFYSSKILPYFQKKSLFFIYQSIKKIMIDFPEIIKIEISHNIFQRKIYLKIKSSKILAEICDLQKCFYLDNYARIIKNQKPENQLIKINSFLEIKENTLLHPLLKNFFLYIFEFANYYSYPIKEIKIYHNFDVAVVDLKNREFLFDPNQDISEQIKKWYIFLKQFDEKFKNSQRIDLRIKQKIYIK